MMELDRKTVEHVAHLARLELTEAECQAAQKDLASILSYVDKMQQLDTSGVAATLGVQREYNVFRKDEARPSADREAILSNAPARKGDGFHIPRILDEV